MTIEEMKFQSELLYKNQLKVGAACGAIETPSTTNKNETKHGVITSKHWAFFIILSTPFIIGGCNWKTMVTSLALFGGVPLVHYQMNVKPTLKKVHPFG